MLMDNVEPTWSDSLMNQKNPSLRPRKLQPLSTSRASSTNSELWISILRWRFTRTILIVMSEANMILTMNRASITLRMCSFPAKSRSWSRFQMKTGTTLSPSTVQPKATRNCLSNLEDLWSMPQMRSSKDMLAKKKATLSRGVTMPSCSKWRKIKTGSRSS